MDIDGGVECWGRNDVGQVNVPEGEYRQISVGVMNTCGLEIGGDLICWGNEENDDLWHVDVDEDGFHLISDCVDVSSFMNPLDIDGDGLSTCDGDCHDGIFEIK